ncbi:MAG: Fur family transcriptional regulator [Clostridia bacterium]|nr:transcriptional repressor [Clostridia bacterium]MDH7572174.1 Fur family transcriptional regulator [Clostridia bacterium]
MALEVICRRLHEHDYKVTPQRQVILEVLTEHPERHLSAEEIYNMVKEKYPEIGLATVYRTLELLADLDILQRMNFNDGRRRYELNDEAVHHHHHLICLRCGRVMEFEDDLLETLEELIARNMDFQVLDHHLKFYGFCGDCRRKAEGGED